MTAVDDPEVGRLDRLLAGHRASIAAQDAASTPYQRQALVDALAYAKARTPGEVVRLRAMVAALEAECAELTRLTATCTCTPYPAGEGPEADCPVHGAVRAFNEATRENAALTDALGHPEVTHEFVLYPKLPLRCDRVGCARPRDAAVHRTPARVRAELEGQR